MIAAFIYAETVAPNLLFHQIADALRAQGLHIAGVLQQDVKRADRPKCDMFLEELGSGARVQVSYDRGPQARGCRLDRDGLARMLETLRSEIARQRPDLIILNKFGKAECEGGGLREIIALALEQDIPMLVGVPQRNLEQWRDFAGDFADEVSSESALQNCLTARFKLSQSEGV